MGITPRLFGVLISGIDCSFWVGVNLAPYTDLCMPCAVMAHNILGGSSCMVKMRPKLPLHGTAKK